MQNVLKTIERALRLDRFTRTSDIIRARAVYIIAILFVISQLLNFVLMYETYGRLTLDHIICAAAIAGIFASIIALRYSAKFYVFAGFYSALIFAGIIFTTVFDYTGINSALLPLLMVGVMLNGFISGWRMVAGFAVMSLALIWYLYTVSAGAPAGALFDPNLFQSRNVQRAIQASLALTMMASISGFFAFHMHAIFYRLEEKIAQVEAAEHEKNRFLANMSHELRTPLNGVMGFINLLGKTELKADQKQYLTIVDKSAHVIMTIVNDALDIAKLDSHNLLISKQPFDLEMVMKAVIHLHKPTALNKSLRLGLNFSADIPRQFVGDEKRIRQIVNRLVANGIKFTDRGSVRININVQQSKAETAIVTIAVCDTGVGLTQEQQTVIFDRFRKIWNQQSQQSEGTGLGLSVASEIAALMGGTITINSALGHGSVFTLSLELPLATDKDAKITVRSDGDEQPELEVLPQAELTQVA